MSTGSFTTVTPKKRKKANRSNKYIYTIGDKYPDSSRRHIPCVGVATSYRGVPADMGWLWTLAQRKGWRPGALGKSVKKWMNLKVHTGAAQPKKKKTTKRKRITEHKEETKTADVGVPPGGSGSVGATNVSAAGGETTSQKSVYDDEEAESDDANSEPPVPEFKSALRVNKVKDAIYVTIHPLKQLLKLEDGEDPFVDCEPIVFKLVQPPSAKMVAHRLSKEKKRYEDDVRKALEQALQGICQCAFEDVYCTDMSAIDQVIQKSPPSLSITPACNCRTEVSESEDSDWDVEYTPPYAMTGMKPKKPVMVHVETQWLESDTATPPHKGKLKWKRSRVSHSQSHSNSNIKLKNLAESER